MNILSTAIFIIWFLSEVLLNRLMRSGKSDKKNADKGSLWLIWIVLSLAIASSVMLSIHTDYPIWESPFVNYSGLVIILAGMALRFYAIRKLGRYFTVDVSIRKGHRIMDEGIYGLVRHPSYTGSLISFFGYGVAQNNWLCLLVVFVPVTLSFVYRIRIEEKALLEQFGAEYAEYKKKTKYLIPYII